MVRARFGAPLALAATARSRALKIPRLACRGELRVNHMTQQRLDAKTVLAVSTQDRPLLKNNRTDPPDTPA